MNTAVVTTQAQLDTALADPQVTDVEIRSERGVWLDVSAFGSATVSAFDSATVRAFDSATVRAFDSATVRASGSATVSASGSATVSAFGSATVRASGSATVSAFGSATVRAFDSATVRAFGSATVRASGSATVSAFDSATVRASGSATVRASDSATVSASDSATVSASRAVAVHLHSARVQVEGGVVIDVSKPITDPREWCEHHGIEVSKAGVATVYKAVNDEWLSSWGLAYKPGTKPAAPDWADDGECGHGLHFSPSPTQALAYYTGATRFLAVGVKVEDLRPLDGGPAKCKAPRVVRACVEVDEMGRTC